MSEIIKEAIMLDEKARADVEAAKMKKANIHETLTAHKKNIEMEYEQLYETKIADYKDQQNKRYDEQKSKNEKAVQHSCEQLEKVFTQHKEEWIDTITHRILSHF